MVIKVLFYRFMILTGCTGEQQLTAAGAILVGPKLRWSAISTGGYVIIPCVLYRAWQRFRHRAGYPERQAFKLSAFAAVTTWGVYPIGYILTTIEGFNLNWIHIAFPVADVINKVGIEVVFFLASKRVLEERVPEEATRPVHEVG